MKKSKIATLAVTAFITIALYIYSLYSAYWTFKRGNVGEIILYTALLALCNGAIMLLYTLTDKKRSHSTANKVIVPIAALLFNAAAYPAIGFGVQKAVSPGVGGGVAAGYACIAFGVALAICNGKQRQIY